MITTNIDKLKIKCNEVSIFEAQQIIALLEAELKQSKVPGIGLAHNQIGGNKMVAIVRIPNCPPIDLVNPKIIESYDIKEYHGEGCLSYPGKSIITKRYNEIFVKDSIHTAGIVCTGLEAVAVQHEIDHLYGRTMYDFTITAPLKSEKCWCGSSKKYKSCHLGQKITQL